MVKKEKEQEIEKKVKVREMIEEKIKEKIEPEIVKELEIEEKKEAERETELEKWIPKTELGKAVKNGKIKDIEEIFEKKLKILEAEIVDKLLPGIEIELINIGQAKGKFGGGKRRPWRQTQKKTAEGNVPTFACMVVVGNKNGYVGLGYGKAKETVPAKQKAIRIAKLNIMKVKRGCGSFDCTCNEPHSIPFKVEGKVGSAVIKLIPAPKGTGLVVDDECKKILKLAGIKDIYSKTFGQTRTKINLAKACILALKKLKEIV
ncbi:MAG: 30S ribosomal protein S5 [Candidatus Pacearchaeota archaeon]|nr:30S ribosomal protein S5 [Candidatus Pacearchaeota archaeon]